MMKNLRKNALLSLIIAIVTVALLTGTVNANGILLINSASENPATDNTAVDNTATTPVENNVSTNLLGVTNTATPTNVQRVNNINDASKDIPQTGESDVYVITAIGIVAIVIGGIAYARSRKYDIR